MSNYIFVDFDGPMLPGKMHLFKRNQRITFNTLKVAKPIFDKFAVHALNILAKYSNAKIIFSTNWALSLDEVVLKNIMIDNGVDVIYHEHCITPKRFSTTYRATEIMEWLRKYGKEGDKFIALDDDTSCVNIKKYLKHNKELGITGKWIEVDFINGLTWKNFTDSCEILDISEDKLNEEEFGIKPLTEEEKIKQEEDLKLLINCMI